MAAPRKSKLRRLAIWLCAGVLACCAARTVGGDLTACWGIHRLAADEPGLSAVPTPLPETGIAVLGGSRIERLGVSIQLPWNSVAKERSLRSVDTLWFSNGVAIALFSPAMQVDSLGVMRSSGASAINRIPGPSAAQSNYAFTAAAMASTPDQAKWWMWPRENARRLLLMTEKSQDALESRTIHPIAAGVMRGFQFGNASDPMVRLILFDTQDRKYMIVIGPKRGAASPLTQSLINALVASLRPLPAGTAARLPAGRSAPDRNNLSSPHSWPLLR
jgi:hypothetical protein